MSLSSLSPPLANDYPWRQCWRCCSMLHSTSLPLLCSKTVRSPRRFGTKALVQSAETQSADGNDAPEEEIQVLSAIRSNYNDIVILDTPKSRILLLDSSNNVHSIFNKGTKWTGSYWDEFASLPAIVPDGPIAIYGLGGGTAAQLMLELWPSLQLEGWEIDQIVSSLIYSLMEGFYHSCKRSQPGWNLAAS